MKAIVLNGSRWHTADDFYDAVLSAVEVPPWYGRSFEAIHKGIYTLGISRRKLRYVIKITGLLRMGRQARAMVQRFHGLVRTLQAAGNPVAIELLD